jgi:hypothetical protein
MEKLIDSIGRLGSVGLYPQKAKLTNNLDADFILKRP